MTDPVRALHVHVPQSRRLTGTESLLAISLILASAGTIDQYLGVGAVVAYALVTLIAVPVLLRVAIPLLLGAERRVAIALAIAFYVAIVVAFALAYPHLNTHEGQHGSDRDDAATMAARHLLHGEYPYSEPTYLGNRISQLPGAVVLAAPFVAIGGNSAYQNLFWLPVLFVALWLAVGDPRPALAAVALVFAAPGAVRELLTGGDLLTNNATLIALSLAIVVILPTSTWLRVFRVAAAIGLGLALSSRANALLLVPLLFAVLARRRGLRDAVVYVGLALLTTAAVTLPFYAARPDEFSPLLTADKVGRFEDVLPHATAFLLCAAGALTLLLAWRIRGEAVALLRTLAIVEAALFAAAVALSSASARSFDSSFLLLGYGLFALVPAAAAYCLELGDRSGRNAKVS